MKKILYKYLSKGRTDVLENQLIRFTQPRDFNDAFEVSPRIDSLVEKNSISSFSEFLLSPSLLLSDQVKQEYERLIDNVIQENNFNQEIQSQLKAKSIEDAMAMAKEIAMPLIESLLSLNVDEGTKDAYQDALHNSISDRFGILCLTEKPNNKLMWAHYADSHEGYAIGFKSDHPFFNSRKTVYDQTGYLRQVIYTKERPIISLYDPNKSEDESLSNLMENVFLKKDKPWKYECEWRMIKELKDATLIKGAFHLFSFPADCIDRVILGAHSNGTLQEKIVNIIRNNPNLNHIKIYKATKGKTDYNIYISREKC